MNTSTMPDRKHIDAAGYFLECLQSNGKISQHDKMRVISSAIVTLADAATICGISAQELWFNYVRLGTLRMYNGDAPATDFIKVTILLQNVMEFFCEQERIKRNHAQSYQNIVKDFIKFGIKNEDDRKQVVQWLSKYFSLPQSEAINFESCTIALSRFFILHPINTIDVSYSCTNSLDNSNNITIENNIDINGLIQVLIDLTETISRAQTTNGNSSPPQESAFWQENPSTNGKQTEAVPPHTGSTKNNARIKTTRQACETVRAEIEQGKHGFQVRGKYKTNHAHFATAVQTILGDVKAHRETVREEWEKVPVTLKHPGRVPEQ